MVDMAIEFCIFLETIRWVERRSTLYLLVLDGDKVQNDWTPDMVVAIALA